MNDDDAPQADHRIIESLRENPQLTAAIAELLWQAAHAEEPETFLRGGLPVVLDAAGGRYVALATVEKGRWTVLDDAGPAQSLPLDLLAEVLNRETACSYNDWVAAPISVRSAAAEVLALRCPSAKQTPASLAAAERLAPVLREALDLVRRRRQTQHDRQRRIRRLEAILEIAAQWNQTHEMTTLLEQMAETSTRLIGAERASIFLWDRANKTLVGRPALGVEGGQLRIPDDRGIVGEVVQTGRPRRVDADGEREEINRQVDRQLGFQTRTLLCVPLRGKGGELFGAFEMINKVRGDFTPEDEDALVELAAHAAVALENTQEHQQLLASRRQIADQAARGVQLVGDSPAVEALRSTIRRVADTDLAILILGENGTGKEVVAQLIHYLSRRRDEPIIAVNCAALAETLLESELFGHEKGAFTDAHEARPGKFELASGGTLFLDEIGDLSPGGQAKLLRVLEEKVVVRVGGSIPIHTDARVIAATNQDLGEMVRARRFREDLYFRLNVVTLDLPPLRQRGEDVLLLADHFLDDFCTKARRKRPRLTAAARRRLVSHPWPGNVRELRNLMERLAYLFEGDKIEASDLAFIFSPRDEAAGPTPLDLPLVEATSRFQIDYIEKQIEAAGGNMSEAAKRLGLHRSNLYRKMRQLGMSTERSERS